MLHVTIGTAGLAMYTMEGLGKLAVGAVVLFFVLIAGTIMLRR